MRKLFLLLLILFVLHVAPGLPVALADGLAAGLEPHPYGDGATGRDHPSCGSFSLFKYFRYDVRSAPPPVSVDLRGTGSLTGSYDTGGNHGRHDGCARGHDDVLPYTGGVAWRLLPFGLTLTALGGWLVLANRRRVVPAPAGVRTVRVVAAGRSGQPGRGPR